MELSKVRKMLEWTGGPAFALLDDRVAACSEDALALGLAEGTPAAALLPGFHLPWPGDPPRETELLWGGRRWTLRACPAEEYVLCFLRTAPDSLPGPNESTLLHTAGAIRTALQELTLALNSMSDRVREDPNAALALRSVYRLRRTVGDLELFAKLRSGSYRFRPGLCCVGAETEQLCRELAPLLRTVGITLRWELPAHDLAMGLDWPLLAALLREMIANAADTTDGEIRLTLSRNEGRKLRFAVRNHPAQPLPEELFHRHAAEPEDLRGGAGLGLSLLSAGAARHGGVFLLSSDERGYVTALLSVEAGSGKDEQSLRGPVRLPSDSDENLVALAEILPVSVFDPAGLLF